MKLPKLMVVFVFQYERLRSDLIVCCASAVLVFAVSVSTAFSSPVLQVRVYY